MSPHGIESDLPGALWFYLSHCIAWDHQAERLAIGSRVIESACNSVVGLRLKPPGSTALCQLRALSESQHILWAHYCKATTVA